MTRDDIYAAILTERDMQAQKWGLHHAWGYGDCSASNIPYPVKVLA